MTCSGFDPSTSLLAGVDPAILQQWLSDAQSARAAFSTGRRELTVIVTGGGQHREVTYRNDPNGMAHLDNWIRQLQAQLGIIPAPRVRARIGYA